MALHRPSPVQQGQVSRRTRGDDPFRGPPLSGPGDRPPVGEDGASGRRPSPGQSGGRGDQVRGRRRRADGAGAPGRSSPPSARPRPDDPPSLLRRSRRGAPLLPPPARAGRRGGASGAAGGGDAGAVDGDEPRLRGGHRGRGDPGAGRNGPFRRAPPAMTSPSPRAFWGTRLSFILAAAGSAVGLGNIWKF